MRQVEGVKMIESFKSGDQIVAVHGYTDADTYRRIVDDEHGPFATIASEVGIEDAGQWLSSERGETLS